LRVFSSRLTKKSQRRSLWGQVGAVRRGLERLESRTLLAAAVQGVGSGLVGNYFSDLNLTNLTSTKLDQSVDFHFAAGHTFSARWAGKVQAQFTEAYTFYTESDEPVRLWVNGEAVVDDWTDHPFAKDSGTISLSAGEFYDIQLEYSDHVGAADLKLKWSSASTAEQVIPASQLYDSGGWASVNWLDEDIGSPDARGFVIGDSAAGAYTVQAGGGMFGIRASDNFHFLHQTLNGDGTIIAQVAMNQQYEFPAEAGVMIRESSDPASKFVAMTIAPGGGAQIQFRKGNGALGTTGDGMGPLTARWVKLVRDGSFFKAYLSQTGTDGTWMLAGTTYVDMGRTVEVGLAAVGSDEGALTSTFTNVSVTPMIPLGGGLDQVRDYSLGNVFVDVAKQMRQPQTTSFGADTPVDSNGWPTTDFGSIFITGFSNSAHIYNGTYKLSFTGRANVSGWSAGPTTVSNVVYNNATNTTTADVIINASESSTQWYSGLIFSSTRRTGFGMPGTGITNIKLIRPGYASNTTQVFTNEYLAHLKQFTTIRFMDFTQTNNNTVANWSNRTKLTDARQSTDKGVAWEYVIQMANLLKKNVWLNIPVNATDDYVKNLAQLLKANLSPDLAVYLEYSNEVWNGSFQQATDDLNAAIAEVNAGGSPLNNDGVNNQYYWAWRRVGKRLKEISDTFATVYGAEAINRKIRPVLSNQFAQPEVAKQQLEWLDQTYGSPSKYIYGIAGAPYFGAGEAIDANPSATVDDYIQGFGDSIAGSAKFYYAYNSYAIRYGLKSLAYEGGSDTFGGGNITIKKAASMDPRMAGLVQTYLDNWYSQGGGLFNWFQAGPTNWETNFGSWGVSNAIDNLTGAKAVGTITVVDSVKTPLSFGIPVPATFDARAQAGATEPYADSYLKSPGNGNSVDYFVRAAKGGDYKLTLRGGTAGSGEQVRVMVNQVIRAITLKNTGSSTTFADNNFGTIRLEEGENVIRVTSLAESSGWNLQTVTVGAPDAANAAPTVVQAVSAGSLISGKTYSLNVLGADDAGESKLVYSWRAVGETAGSVTWSANGSNAAKSTRATFSRTGTFTLECTIFDGTLGVTSSLQVVVNQIATTVSVSPGNSFVPNNGTQQFGALVYDQFGMVLLNQPAVTWSLDSGSVGSLSSTGTYTAPASIMGSATVRATVGSLSGTASVLVQIPRTPENPANALAGIAYKYFEGLWQAVPNFDSMTPIKTGTLASIDTSPRQVTDGYGFQYVGYVTVPATGTYTFYTSSDDGSTLYIGNTLVVNNDNTHGNQERSGQIVLAAGTHAFKVNYFEGQGGEALSVSYSGPGVAKQLIPASALWHTRNGPTVATPANVVPYPVPGTQAAVSVLGADEGGEAGLTYTWTTTVKPAGAPDPTFNVNGTNGAKNSTVTFGQAGSYGLLVTISNGIMTTTSSVSVTVSQTLASLLITPSQPTMGIDSSQQINPTGQDQFGNAMATLPALNWSVQSGGGSIDPAGMFTSNRNQWDVEIFASYGSVSASTVVMVRDEAPQITDGPTATFGPDGKVAQFHVAAADDGGAENLSYQWWLVSKPDGAGDPVFANGGDLAADASVTFDKSGWYTYFVTVYDGFSEIFAQMNVHADQVVSAIAVSPGSVSLAAGATQLFNATAFDQFGDQFSSAPQFDWSVVGGGSITGNGFYTASGSSATVTAAVGSVTGQATVNVNNNNAPTIAQAASASPQTGTSTAASLAVLGADDGGEGNLTYTWSTSSRPTGSPAPTFAANGTNAAKSSLATFGQVGSYTFVVTISDGLRSTTSTVTATVNPKTTSVVVTPGSINVSNGATQQFVASARDQFGNAMVQQPGFTWTLQGGGGVAGSVSSNGVYTAPASGSPQDVVKASATGTLSGTVTGSATVNVNGSNQSIFTSEGDVGGPATAGSSSISNGTYTVRGGGTHIWDPGDQFHFVYKQMTGDATIIARIAGITGTNARASAGIMFRENLTATSNHVMFEGSPDQTATFFARYTNGFTASSRQSGGFAAPFYVKLVRSGDDFRGYTSSDGTNWTLFASTNVTMNSTYYVGLAVSANDATLLNTATFDHVSLSAGAQESSLAMRAASVTETSSMVETSAIVEDTQIATISSVAPISIVAVKVAVNPRLVKGAGNGPMVRVNVGLAKKIAARKLEVPDVKTI
jgi:regulation of enolase protein 1 (concanavalin A-like superfamily)